MYTHIKNLQWANAAHTLLNCEVNFSHLQEEYVPFTASPDDSEDHVKQIYTRAINGEFGEIKEYFPLFSQDEVIRLKWSAMYQLRNQLLYQSDWTQLIDVPLTIEEKATWATYRQALRDVPQNITDIDNISWPVPPGGN